MQQRTTQYIVQPYRTGRHGGLMPAEPIQMQSAEAATERARKLFETGRYAGADAYMLKGDRETGEYGEPEFLARLGRVWPVEM